MRAKGTLIGCGFFAENHLNAWKNLDLDMVAVCDLDPAKAAGAAQRFGIARHYSSAEDMLLREKPDFVDIVTTVDSHRLLVELAARHGVAAICQKPFATSLGDADAMIDACERAGVPLMVHENFRWQEPMLAVRKALDQLAMGTAFFGRISFRHDYNIYAVQPYLAEIERFAILDVGIHLIDLARFFFGEVAALSCATQSVNPRIRGDDVATLLLQHEGGATSIVDMSFFTHLSPNPFPQTTVEIDATKGSIRLMEDYRLSLNMDGQISRTVVDSEVKSWMERPWHCVQDSVLNIQRHWLDVLRTGGTPATSGRDNRRTLQIGLLAYEAAATGTTIKL
jgi:D-apiose dehydrogenase